MLWEDNNEYQGKFQWSNIRGSETIFLQQIKTINAVKLLVFIVKCSLVLTILEDLNNTITKALSFTSDKCIAGLKSERKKIK